MPSTGPIKNITADELRSLFIRFFTEHAHTRIQNSSVIPENDPTSLFIMAGMQPLVPYLMGTSHPSGTRLANVQKCIRTIDIDDVGDDSHNTFFEMLGNWSLGDYFKKEAITWSYEFLTSPEWLGIPVERLAFSVFEGDEKIPRDTESFELWKSLGIPKDRIFFLPKENNFWSLGPTGPCGPDTEMFIITDKPPCSPDCSPACDCGRYLEIWNNVFMAYNRQTDGSIVPLEKTNVDTGMGLERTLCTLRGEKSCYETELFTDIIAKISELCKKPYAPHTDTTRAFRIIADHMRTATIILGDEKGVTPSNVDQGYVLRRLIRRAVRMGLTLEAPAGFTVEVAKVVIDQYSPIYAEIGKNREHILEQLRLEEERFARTVRQGIREFDKIYTKNPGQAIDGKSAFHLYDTFGFPIEMTVEMAKERGVEVDVEGFNENFKAHQQLSQAGATQRFSGGLADNSEQTARLHTATHLLHAALRKVLGPEVAQKGSNITAERLRFDFSFPRKMTKEEIASVQDIVNEAISSGADVVCAEMTVDEAKEAGAIGLFEAKYGERVKVYTMGAFSKEICGGPHAGNTSELSSFKIQKEESSSAGVRRIKAVIGSAK